MRVEATHEQAAQRLQDAGFRYTTARRNVVQALFGAGRPVTVPQLLSAVDGVPQSSAYRTLTILVDVGLAVKVSGSDDYDRFELAEGVTGHHHHLFCATCGTVTDLEPSTRLELALDEAALAVTAMGYSVSGHRFDLVGTCPTCTALTEE